MQFPLLLLPLLLPLFAAILCIMAWRYKSWHPWIFLSGSVGMLAGAVLLLNSVLSNGIHTLQAGNWPAPFGITLVADILSAGLIVVAAIIGFVVYLYAFTGIDKRRSEFGFYPLLLFLLFGICGAFLAGDIFNLYVWFEIMLVSSFTLLTLGGTRDQLEGAIKYVVINFIASALFLAGIGVLYGLTGSLNMADIALFVRNSTNPALFNIAAVFFFISFGIKSALFPLYFWLPASYHTPPIAITAMIGGLLTKVGAYVFIRFFTLIFVQDIDYTHDVLLFAAGLTMVAGALGAIAQNDLYKILSYSIVSQIGYMIMGLAIFTPLAIAGAVFFLVQNVFVKTNLFLISGIVYNSNRSYKLRQLGGIYMKLPIVAFLFGVAAFSLVGIPPLTGFWGKYLLARAGLEIQAYYIVAVALVVSIFTLIYITKIWNEVFWKKDPDPANDDVFSASQRAFVKDKFWLVFPVIIISAILLFIGIFPEPVIALSHKAAEQLMNPELYINAVLQKN